MTAETDRWLIDGDCSKCRREPYCAKDCTAYKRAMAYLMTETLMKILYDKKDSQENEEDSDEVLLSE